MDGSEDKRVTSPDPEPPWLVRVRFWRTAFDLTFPPLVLAAAVVVTPVLFVTEQLDDPKSQGTWAGILVTLAGILWGRGRTK